MLLQFTFDIVYCDTDKESKHILGEERILMIIASSL